MTVFLYLFVYFSWSPLQFIGCTIAVGLYIFLYVWWWFCIHDLSTYHNYDVFNVFMHSKYSLNDQGKPSLEKLIMLTDWVFIKWVLLITSQCLMTVMWFNVIKSCPTGKKYQYILCT